MSKFRFESSLRVRLLAGDEPLPPGFDRLFADARSGNIFRSLAWLQNFCRNGIPPGDRIRLYAVESQADGAPLAVLPVLYSRLYDAHPRARVLHVLQPEGPAHGSPLPIDGDDPATMIEQLVGYLRASRQAYDVLRFSPLERDAPVTAGLIAVLRRTRHATQTYRLFRDCFETTSGLSSRDYMAVRPPALRETLEATAQKLFADGRASFQLIHDAGEVETGWRHYRQILDANDAAPEPEPPGYLPGAMRVAAEAGALRLGLIHLEGTPVAVQLWIVTAGTAQCMRIWSAQHLPELRLNDLLTERLVAHLLDVDRVAELDFGAVDEEFALNWAPKARERVGLAAFNPRTWRGIKGAMRHVGAELARTIPRRIWHRVRGRQP